MNRLLFAAALLASLEAAGQVSISGYVSDAETGERLIGAAVYDMSSGQGATTNAYGFYSLSVPGTGGPSRLQATYIGYAPMEWRAELSQDTRADFELVLRAPLEEVVVSADRKIEERVEMGVLEMPMSQIARLPMLGGETDLLKAMQLMAGVQAGSEGQSSMLVRGGSHDQNLILLDGVPLYSINHLGGFVSLFNPDAINSARLHKGGFPARYGGRLSSIMDVRMKDGNTRQRATSVTLGLISSKFQHEGPIRPDTASYMVSARRFMYDWISRPVSWLSNEGQATGYTFYDLNLKLNGRLTDSDRLFFSFYVGNDKLLSKKNGRGDESSDKMRNQAQWGNLMLATRWNHVFGNRFFANVTASHTRYANKSEFKFTSQEAGAPIESAYNFTSGISDWGVGTDFEWRASRLALLFGTSHVHHTFTPASSHVREVGSNLVDSSFNSQRYAAFENNFYVESQLDAGDRLGFNLGARASAYSIDGKLHANLAPRLLASYNAAGRFSLKASYGHMVQHVHLLPTAEAGISGDLWMPSTRDIPPQRSEQIALGIYKTVLEGQVELGIEAYSKRMHDLVAYKDGVGIATGSVGDWERQVETGGTGRARGLEFMVQKSQGRLNGWVAYTLSRSTRQFDGINSGKEFLATHDATHDFSIVAGFQWLERLHVSMTWVYTTGKAITMPNEVVPTVRLIPNPAGPGFVFESYAVRNFTERNHVRMEPFHRLDLALTYEKEKKGGSRVWSFSLYNAYNRQNPYFYYTTRDELRDPQGNGTGQYRLKTYQRSLFPIIPSVSYTMRF